MSASPNVTGECTHVIQDNGQQPCNRNKSSPPDPVPWTVYLQTTLQEHSLLPDRLFYSINVGSSGASTFSARSHSAMGALYVASFGGLSSIMGNEASLRDIQELLEKATSLIRRMCGSRKEQERMCECE